MNKDSIKSVIVLGAICLIVAVLLSSVNAITAPIIKERKEQEQLAAFSDILPGATKLDELPLSDKYPETIKSIKKDAGGAGFVFELSTSKGYSGKPIVMLVSFNLNGKIVKLNITEYSDSAGFGSKEIFESLYTDKQGPVSDMHAGATKSSTAVRNAINDAYAVFCELNNVELSDEDKIKALAKNILPYADGKGDNYDLFEVEIKDLPKSITKVYETLTKSGYVVLAQSGDTSVAIGINAYGKVIYMSDLEGKDLMNSSKFDSVKADAEAIPSIYSRNHDRIVKKLSEVVEGVEIEEFDFGKVSSNVVAVYQVGDNFAYVANGDGYGGLITVCYVIDSAGNIVAYKTIEQSERADEYSGNDYGTVIGYKNYPEKFEGLTTETVTDETLLIAGATKTTDAITACWNDIKAAHKLITEEVGNNE